MVTVADSSVAARARYEPVIGLEVHVQLLTVTKIFCSCSTRFGDPPNTNVCPVCLGLPGALPVLNRKAVEFAVLAAMALNSRVNETSIFARKNYFYPDLPKGYQISQYDRPLAEHGWIEIDSKAGAKKIGITRLHLEEDAGKSLHEGFPDAEKTAIDLNRSGVPLIEIVSEPGSKVTQETRLYNANEGKTYGMRSKEQAHDYRYFPEPDLLPLVVVEKWRADIRALLPEFPEARRERMIADYGITEKDAQVLTSSKALADQFEEAAKSAKNPKRVANLVQSELMGRLKSKGLEIERSPISMKGVAQSSDLVDTGAISGKMLKDLYDMCFERGKDFPPVYEEEGRPQQSSDTSALEKIVDELIAANPKQVEQYRAGKKTVAGFFVGQVMKASKGQANPQLVNELVAKKLG